MFGFKIYYFTATEISYHKIIYLSICFLKKVKLFFVSVTANKKLLTGFLSGCIINIEKTTFVEKCLRGGTEKK
jgi:hypothetical protein